MQWGDIAELCGEECRRLQVSAPRLASYFPAGSNTANKLLEFERLNNEAVARAVRQFAQNRTWPELSELEKIMLGFRLEFAGLISQLLSEQPAPWTDNEADNVEERVGWLMLFAWENGGFDFMLGALKKLTTVTNQP
jgi:hypothetical protein